MGLSVSPTAKRAAADEQGDEETASEDERGGGQELAGQGGSFFRIVAERTRAGKSRARQVTKKKAGGQTPARINPLGYENSTGTVMCFSMKRKPEPRRDRG